MKKKDLVSIGEMETWWFKRGSVLFPFLLRYNWCIILHWFHVYNVMIWYLYTLWNDYNKSSYCLSLYEVIFFCLEMRTFKIYSQQLRDMQYNFTDYSCHPIHHFLMVYLFYNWKFVSLDPLYPFCPPSLSISGNLQSGLCISEFCLSGCTYKRNYTVFVFHGLTHFTYHNDLEVHPCSHKWQDFLLFCG